jgi:hypothetical protein
MVRRHAKTGIMIALGQCQGRLSLVPLAALNELLPAADLGALGLAEAVSD